MSGGQDSSKGGGKAFGEVEDNVKKQRIDAAGRYACAVLNTQLIPSILALNYGDTENPPRVRLLEDEEGSLDEAQRDQVLAAAGLKIGVNFLRKKYGLPKPAEGEETIGGTPEAKEQGKDSREGAEARSEKGNDPLKSGEGDGHPFHGNQWEPGEHVELPDEHWTGSAKEMSGRADAIMRGFGPATHPRLGPVEFTQQGRSKTLYDKRTPHEFQAVQAIPDIIRKGRWTGSRPDRKGRPEVAAFHTVQAPLSIGGKHYRAEVTLKEMAGKKVAHKFYLHRLHDPQEGPVKGKATSPYNANPPVKPGRGPGGTAKVAPQAGRVNSDLSALAAIEDDALFAKALNALAAAL